MTTLCAPEEREHRLHELRVDEWADLVLAALALAAAVASSFLHPPLAVPLLMGGVAGLVLSGRAFFRRLDLVDELLLDPGAYEIPEIRRRAEKTASMAGRRDLARTARGRATTAPLDAPLLELADDLENEELSFDPLCAAQCRQLFTDYDRSPLLNSELPPEDTLSWIRRIRLGFDRRPAA